MQRWGVMTLAGLVWLGGCAPPSSEGYKEPVADFNLTERSGRQVQRADLLGKVWVAAFVFTRCAGPCSQISGTMARLQHELAEEDDLVLVSFTVDPEHDTPEVLTSYAERFGAQPERWWFLTGPKEDVYRLIQQGFNLAVAPTTGTAHTPGNEVFHSTRLAVVDRNGYIRGYFDGRSEEDLVKLKEKVRDLVRE